MYSIEQRVFLILEYHRLEQSPTATRCSFRKRFNAPKGQIIHKHFARFERTGSVVDDRVGNVEVSQTVGTPENVSTYFCNCSAKVKENHPKNCTRDWFEVFHYAGNIEKQPTHVSIQNTKSSSHTHKSCATL
ncbi:DUF4817 domain-containing protein [Nephila pilipes]|uniref:DUF4817 domain-containing protein n=1 Tax=Nephila pilipes TaxID=299642 RepID=A0A8X6UFQ2_NEPPI|nr:DUF4817 domain-containing protein [Nephila pilipes]